MSVNEQKIQIMHEILTRLNYYSKIHERTTVKLMSFTQILVFCLINKNNVLIPFLSVSNWDLVML